MKKQLMPFLKTFAFIFISYLFISIIMALLLSFIHMSSFIYSLLINIFSYIIMIMSAILFFKLNKDRHLLYAFAFAIIYALIVILSSIDQFQLLLLVKPLIFFIINIILYILKKKQQ